MSNDLGAEWAPPPCDVEPPDGDAAEQEVEDIARELRTRLAAALEERDKLKLSRQEILTELGRTQWRLDGALLAVERLAAMDRAK